MRNRWWAVPLGAGAAALIAACGSSGTPPASQSTTTPPPAQTTGPSPGSSSVTIKTGTTSKGTVLSTASGMTIYWFAIDTSTTSNCTGSCATYWPPVIGTPAAASGTSLPMSFGTIKRADGTTQATYDGHPLYTYVGDKAAGDVTGNGLNLSGGLWWAMTPSGAKVS